MVPTVGVLLFHHCRLKRMRPTPLNVHPRRLPEAVFHLGPATDFDGPGDYLLGGEPQQSSGPFPQSRQ